MKLVIATHNKNKVQEIKAILNDTYEVVCLDDLHITKEVDETGTTFLENAILKASGYPELKDCFILADDSGLEIDALDKKPGVESARFLGHDTPYEIKNAKIIEMIADKNDRTARYVCAIALVKNGEVLFSCEESMEGEIAQVSDGANGFGYDPIFYYPPFKMTTARMSPEDKNEVSHRGKALRKTAAYLNAYED